MFRYLAACFMLCAAMPAAAQTIGPGPGAQGGYITADSSTAYGQTFTSPGGTLNSVSFSTRVVGNAGGSFTFDIYSITGTTLGNAALYSSTFTPATFATATFSNLNVATASGATYAYIVTPFGANAGATTVQLWEDAGGGYTGGNVILSTNVGNPDGVTFADQPYDLSFSATFVASAAPEPASWALMIGGFTVAGAALRRKRRRVLQAA